MMQQHFWPLFIATLEKMCYALGVIVFYLATVGMVRSRRAPLIVNLLGLVLLMLGVAVMVTLVIRHVIT
jgi:hypothetical protein